MRIQDQCCSLEQAKKLKELGIAQDGSYFRINPEGELVEEWMLDGTEDFIACFTVSELGVMMLSYLPRGCTFSPLGSEWFHTWHNNRYEYQAIIGPFQTEAEARAAMLIHLLENNLITAAQVNARLKG